MSQCPKVVITGLIFDPLDYDCRVLDELLSVISRRETR